MSFNNFGKTVSAERLDQAEHDLKVMLPDLPTEDRLVLLGYFRERIERDFPAILIAARPPAEISALDLTGRYRLLSVMLTDPVPVAV